MPENSENRIPDYIIELTDKIAQDTTIINLPIMMCDLMAMIYTIEDYMQQNKGVPSFPHMGYIFIRDILISKLREYYPTYIDFIYDKKSLDSVISYFEDVD